MIRRLVVREKVVEGFLHPSEFHFRREREDQVDKHRAQVSPVPSKHGGAFALAEQECEDRHIRFGAVAVRAGEYEVVSPVVGALASSRCDVVERDGRGGDTSPAVGAHGTMLL